MFERVCACACVQLVLGCCPAFTPVCARALDGECIACGCLNGSARALLCSLCWAAALPLPQRVLVPWMVSA